MIVLAIYCDLSFLLGCHRDQPPLFFFKHVTRLFSRTTSHNWIILVLFEAYHHILNILFKENRIKFPLFLRKISKWPKNSENLVFWVDKSKMHLHFLIDNRVMFSHWMNVTTISSTRLLPLMRKKNYRDIVILVWLPVFWIFVYFSVFFNIFCAFLFSIIVGW